MYILDFLKIIFVIVEPNMLNRNVFKIKFVFEPIRRAQPGKERKRRFDLQPEKQVRNLNLVGDKKKVQKQKNKLMR